VLCFLFYMSSFCVLCPVFTVSLDYPFLLPPSIFSNVYLQASSLNKIPIFQESSPIARAPSPVNKTVSLTFIFGHHHRLAPTTGVSLLTLILHFITSQIRTNNHSTVVRFLLKRWPFFKRTISSHVSTKLSEGPSWS